MKNTPMLFIVFLLVASACSNAQPSIATSVPARTAIVTQAVPSSTPQPAPADSADIIFFNGQVVTVEAAQPSAQAIAIKRNKILAVGTDAQVLALRGPKTKVVDLQGKALLPGFIDGHTHILAFPGRKGKSLDEAQETALRYGFTTVNEMWADQGYLDTLLQAERGGRLRLRVNVFASYNDGVLDKDRRRVMLEAWYPKRAPILDLERFLRIPGIKIFLDGDNWTPSRGCWALSEPLMPAAPPLANGVCGSDRGDLYWSQDELNRVVSDAQNAGYRVVFHAMGDQAIETALNAIEYALNGQSNKNYRHQIEHNSLARPDQLPRYKSLDVLTSVRGYGDFCDLQFLVPDFGPDRRAWYANRYALPGLGIHAYVETDFGWTVDPDDRFSQRSLDPIMQLYGMVTHRYVAADGSACEPDPLVAAHPIGVERALQMLTIEPAYAVSMEDYTGSLKPGKFADLVILNNSPLKVQVDSLKDLRVLMTMVDGKVEFCASGQSSLCPAIQPAALPTLPKSGNLALGRSVTASKSGRSNPPEMAVDGKQSTHWGADDFQPQWIEVDLGAPAAITSIRLLTNQYPDGKTVHRILARSADGDFSEVYRFDRFTRSDEWLVFTPEKPLEDIQVLRIETLSSPSWVAWSEIQVIGER